MSTHQNFLRLPAVIERVGLSRTAIYREIAAGTFPASVRIGARAVAWNSSDIEKWQQEKIAGTAQTKTTSHNVQ